jgi:hypothetical protein
MKCSPSSDEAERGQQTEFLLERHGERALLSCKHGSAYRLTPPIDHPSSAPR